MLEWYSYSRLLPKTVTELRRLAVLWIQDTIEETSERLTHQAIRNRLRGMEASSRTNLSAEIQRETHQKVMALRDEIHARENHDRSPRCAPSDFPLVRFVELQNFIHFSQRIKSLDRIQVQSSTWSRSEGDADITLPDICSCNLQRIYHPGDEF
jgi:hypothetical protein